MSRQRQLVEESKRDAIQALTEGFTDKMERLQTQLSEKDATVSNIARYFEEVVAELTEKSHRDPKTKLLNFDWFMERLESFLAVEQRVRWCGVGVVDITSFKRYNDTLGHAIGDCIIERVAQILSDQIRSEDVLALERVSETRDLHARFGGDEFCFLIPHLPGCVEATEIAQRFKQAVERHDWAREDPRLAANPGQGRRRRRLPAAGTGVRAPRRREGPGRRARAARRRPDVRGQEHPVHPGSCRRRRRRTGPADRHHEAPPADPGRSPRSFAGLLR